MYDENGKSRGFGFVAFEDAETAEVACNEMNGKDMEGKTLYVGRAQKRAGKLYQSTHFANYIASFHQHALHSNNI